MKTRKNALNASYPPLKFDAGAWNGWGFRDGRTSLVRYAPKPRPVQLDAYGQAIEFDLVRSALIVIDMQNDFCHPLGWFGQKGISVKPTRKPIPVGYSGPSWPPIPVRWPPIPMIVATPFSGSATA
jgi:ureidoacrylate peracid hydrolase